MGRVIHIACLGAGLASGLLAQLPFPPCYPRVPAPDPSFGATALSTPGFTVSEVAQLELKPTTTPGTYILSATVRFSSGGAGGFDLLMGQWNAATGFTKSNWVDGLNTSADEFALTLNSSQTSVAFDRYPGNAMAASRPSLTSPFTGAMPISGVPAGGVDPAFGRFGTTDVLFFLDGSGNILYGTFDAALAIVTNVHVCTFLPAGATFLHSPRPIDDQMGQTQALIFSAAMTAGGSDAWFDPDPRDAPAGESTFRVHSDGSWLANPDANGGTLRYATAAGTYSDPVQIDTFLTDCDCATPAGGNWDLTAIAPQKSGTPYLAAVGFGVPRPTPVSLPCIKPPKCPNPCHDSLIALVSVNIGSIDRETGTFTLTIAVPPLLPVGVRLDTQVLYLDFDSPDVFSSNVGGLRVRATCR